MEGSPSGWCFLEAICREALLKQVILTVATLAVCSLRQKRQKCHLVLCLTLYSQFLAPKDNPNEDAAAVFEEGGDIDDLVSIFNIYQVF